MSWYKMTLRLLDNYISILKKKNCTLKTFSLLVLLKLNRGLHASYHHIISVIHRLSNGCRHKLITKAFLVGSLQFPCFKSKQIILDQMKPWIQYFKLQYYVFLSSVVALYANGGHYRLQNLQTWQNFTVLPVLKVPSRSPLNHSTILGASRILRMG